MIHGWLAGRAATFVLGVASGGVVLEVVGGPLRRAARAATREVIRGGLRAAREIRRVSDSVTQEIEDITAEVRADLDASEDATGQAAAEPGMRRTGGGGRRPRKT